MFEHPLVFACSETSVFDGDQSDCTSGEVVMRQRLGEFLSQCCFESAIPIVVRAVRQMRSGMRLEIVLFHSESTIITRHTSSARHGTVAADGRCFIIHGKLGFRS